MHEWATEEQHAKRLAPRERVDLALSLVREQNAEDKLAGILCLREILIPENAVVLAARYPTVRFLFRTWLDPTGTMVLRELSPADRNRVIDFVDAHLARFTRESLKSAVAKLPDRTAKRLLRAHLAR